MYTFINLLRTWVPILLYGLGQTFKISLYSALVGLGLGILIGILTSNKVRIPFISILLDTYTFCVICIPFYTQLLIMYFAVPYAIGIPLSPTFAGIFSLGICSSGYVAQIIRGGINSLPNGQWLAAKALGYSRYATLRYIILPQVINQTIPALGNEFIQVIHATSVISAIGAIELTKVASNIIAREMNPLTIYPITALLYLVISGGITLLFRKIEQRRAVC